MRKWLWLALAVVLATALLLALWLTLREPAPDRLDLEPARFSDLPGWKDDDHAAALAAFLRSCARIGSLPPEAEMGGAGFAGTARDWQKVCAAAARVERGKPGAARQFFEKELAPFAVSNRGKRKGLFTGYYEPLLHGSRTRKGPYETPLYLRPPELVMVDLGRFREELAGQRIAGKVEGGDLVPYPDRTEIVAGALSGRDLELVWVDSAADAFFLEIQGSGRIRMDDGTEMRVGYAAQNGHPYFAIGRELVARGELKLAEVSLQSIKKWLADHPAEAGAVMARNRSYVFFREIEGDGPVGAEATVLTPGRSLAVDRKFLPLGIPVWLDGKAPDAEESQPDWRLRRLLVAQDTGGAIRGPVRGDLFWGHGQEAEAVAGRMKYPGRLWVLLPSTIAPQNP